MKQITISLILMALLLACCTTPKARPTLAPVVEPTQNPQQEIANPASLNCTEQGGTLTIETRGDDSLIWGLLLRR